MAFVLEGAGRSGGAWVFVGLAGFRAGKLPGLAPLPLDPAKLPYAGITRIRFEGSVSTGR
jgi:hypothetical protein